MTTKRVTEIRRILCPVDFSEFSASVLVYAARFAKLFGSDVTVLHVFATAVPPASSATYPAWLLQVPEARKSIADELKHLAQLWRLPADQTRAQLWSNFLTLVDETQPVLR